MKYRKLRIAWSVAWGVVAVLLCVLWVRSYATDAFWNWPNSSQVRAVVHSSRGDLVISRPLTAAEFQAAISAMNNTSDLTSANLGTPNLLTTNARIPYWKICAALALLATAPWFPLKRSFSLRTLPIATTLFAVALGFIVWASR